MKDRAVIGTAVDVRQKVVHRARRDVFQQFDGDRPLIGLQGDDRIRAVNEQDLILVVNLILVESVGLDSIDEHFQTVLRVDQIVHQIRGRHDGIRIRARFGRSPRVEDVLQRDEGRLRRKRMNMNGSARIMGMNVFRIGRKDRDRDFLAVDVDRQSRVDMERLSRVVGGIRVEWAVDSRKCQSRLQRLKATNRFPVVRTLATGLAETVQQSSQRKRQARTAIHGLSLTGWVHSRGQVSG